jgi:thioredoxin 1
MNRRIVSAFSIVLFTAIILTGMSCNGKKSESEAKKDAPVIESPAAENPAIEKQPAQSQPVTPDSTTIADSSALPQEKKEPVSSIGDLDKLNAIVEGTPGKLLVFDLYADWCVPCKILAPLYDSLAVKHGKSADFYRVDVQRSQDIAAAFGVRGIPFVVFMKDKKVVQAITGLNPAESYERVITTCGGSASVSECQEKLSSAM